MEEKNELNDIILNKGGASSASKKLLLAIATLTLILIIVLVIMNSLKNNDVQQAPQAVLPPEPTAPTEIINDPLFEPVEVIQEGNDTAGGDQDLNKLAQKIKEESMQETPTVAPTPAQVVPAEPVVPVQKPTQVAPVAPKPTPATPSATPKKVVAAAIVKTPKIQPIKAQPATIKQEAKKTPVTPKAVAQTPQEETKEAVVEPTTESKEVVNSGETWYIQVGSFTKEPDQALFNRLNASGMKYTTQKTGETTKILVGPFQGNKAVHNAMKSIRQNVEAKAFKIKG